MGRYIRNQKKPDKLIINYPEDQPEGWYYMNPFEIDEVYKFEMFWSNDNQAFLGEVLGIAIGPSRVKVISASFDPNILHIPEEIGYSRKYNGYYTCRVTKL